MTHDSTNSNRKCVGSNPAIVNTFSVSLSSRTLQFDLADTYQINHDMYTPSPVLSRELYQFNVGKITK